MPASQPRLALCIPAYNAAGFLPRLIESARNQSMPFDEIWVHDDASSDATADLALRHGVRVIRSETNVGCSCGKNRLAQATECEWIHFHDADDVLRPDFVAAARPWMERAQSPDIVLFAYQAIDETTGAALYVRSFDGNALAADPVAYCLLEQINPFCGLYRRSAFLAAEGWDEDPAVLYSEDQAGHLRLAVRGLSFTADPTVSVINHIRPNSMSTGHPERGPRADVAFLEKNLSGIAPRLHPILARRLWRAAGAAGAFLDWRTADRAIALARRIAPGVALEGSASFRVLARIFPRTALRLRERWVRLTRPELRPLPSHHPRKR